jgi:hypothetical protein
LLTAGGNRKKPYRKSLFYREDVRDCRTLPEEQLLIIRRLLAPLTVVALAILAGQAIAQGAFPAPLPGQTAAPGGAPSNASPFPPVNGGAPAAAAPQSSFPAAGAAPFPGGGFGGGPPPGAPTSQAAVEECMKGFLPLREEAEKRGKMIKAASDRHAQPAEACKLIENFSQAEVKMMKYVETHAAKCGIPPQISDQLKGGHKNTETMQQKVCAVAQQQQRGPAGPSLSEVLGSSAALPEATNAVKKGGSTFDTLNGNVLSR